MEVELESEHHEHSKKHIGIMIAVMAGVLAFVEMGAHNATIGVVRETIEASDTWAFYQAKTIRASMLRADAKSLQLIAGTPASAASPNSELAPGEGPNGGIPDSASQNDVSKTVADWLATAAREDSEPSTGEGRKELTAKAQAIEKHRDERNAAKETYELASGALELGILLASSAIVTGLAWLGLVGGGLGALGAALGVLGWLAPHLIGG